ncbi:Uncharacterized protein OBRU01_25883, partial [Operophtera brumata]
IRTDDYLPKAICHNCLQQVAALHLYAVQVDKTQKFLNFHQLKANDEKKETQAIDNKLNPIVIALSVQNIENTGSPKSKSPLLEYPGSPTTKTPLSEFQQGDAKPNKSKPAIIKKKSPSDMKFMEAMTLEEFAKAEKLDTSLLSSSSAIQPPSPTGKLNRKKESKPELLNQPTEVLDPVVLIDGRPAKQGAALDKQITLFYKMECCICHENGFHFRSLMKHYKDRHGVPGYVTCCDKKFHYFYPKKIIEHMAYHLQPNIFMCASCHKNFPTSHELLEHQSNGGRSEGKITCPRCSERFPTYHELGWHLVTHRSDKLQCDYCGKQLKHHHRKKTVMRMEDKEKVKSKSNDVLTLQKLQKFRQAMGLSGDEDGSTD